MSGLNNFKKKIYSQYGEDGIIEEILKRLDNDLDLTCCEFGAWDGEYLSNVYNLVKNKNYKVLYIEGDYKKFNLLKKNFATKNAITINKFVKFEGKDTLDEILSENNFNKSFDLLSIDIDGNDYYILESLKKYTPKVIIIEFNPTIPNEIEFVQKKDIKINQGSSALSLNNLAKKKGYYLVAATETNLFFLHKDYQNKVTNNKDFELNEIVDDKNYRNFVWTGFDGKIFTNKKINLIWHKIEFNEIKILPKFLQKFPDNYNFFEKVLFRFYRNLINPRRLKKKIYSLFSKK